MLHEPPSRIVGGICSNDMIEKANEINSVLLKIMPDGTAERYYFVRPGQRLRREKFLSKTLKGAKNHMTFKIWIVLQGT